MDYRNSTDIENIFLTGSTGVLGARVLMELLETTDAVIYCLIRAKNHAEGMERIKKIFFDYDPERHLEDELLSRVMCVLGDITKKRFGLDKQNYSELTDTIDMAIHSAANTSLIAGYMKLKPINVDGAKHVIDFCLESGAPLTQVSSYSVIGSKLYEDVVFNEDDYDIGQKFNSSHVYERTKFESEKLVREAGAKGLKWAIVRPGNIFGDSRTGCYPLFSTTTLGIYYELVRAIIESGYYFGESEIIDVSPVDYVAKALVYIALNVEEQTNEQTYHLVNQAWELKFVDFVKIIQEYGYTVRKVDTDEYIKALKKRRVIREGGPYQSNFTNLLVAAASAGEMDPEIAHIDTTKIQDLLQETDITCAKPDIQLMKVYLDYAIKAGLVASPQNQVIAEMVAN